jgi:PAT family beta-lactamase induction signal transducer AmpG
VNAASVREGLRVYFTPRLILILVLGFASGLPLLLTSSTLTIRLREAGVDLGAIGFFSLVGIPYSLKFLWAPLLDRLPLPGITSRYGRRRGWMLAIHLGLMAAIATLGSVDPMTGGVGIIAVIAILVSFLSATQDIAIDAYRIEILKESEFGAGAAMAVYGFRGGMLMATVGTLYLAEWFDWEIAYQVTAATLLIGVAAILLAPEPDASGTVTTPKSIGELFGQAYWAPLKEFKARDGWLLILLFVLLFKFGDALLSQMAGALYVDLGFEKSTIAEVGKLYGFIAVMVGTFLGGLAVVMIGLGRTLLIAGFLQAISNLGYWRLAEAGNDVTMLAWVVGFENLATGLGQTAFVAFLMTLCDRRYTAAQFAMLTSIVAFSPKVLVAPAGLIAESLGWPVFCLATAIAAIPGILLLLYLLKAYPETWCMTPLKEI